MHISSLKHTHTQNHSGQLTKNKPMLIGTTTKVLWMNNSQCSSMKQLTNKDSSTNNAHFQDRISHPDSTSKWQAFFLAAYLLVQSSFPLNFQSGCWKAAFSLSDLVPSTCIILMSPQGAKIKILSLCIFICSPTHCNCKSKVYKNIFLKSLTICNCHNLLHRGKK